MARAATVRLPMSTLDEDAWDNLLSFSGKRRGIPIVGPELLRLAIDHGPRLLYDWLAEKLAARLNVDVAALPQPSSLNDVACWFLAARAATRTHERPALAGPDRCGTQGNARLNRITGRRVRAGPAPNG
jgi:hypothetical protein